MHRSNIWVLLGLIKAGKLIWLLVLLLVLLLLLLLSLKLLRLHGLVRTRLPGRRKLRRHGTSTATLKILGMRLPLLQFMRHR